MLHPNQHGAITFDLYSQSQPQGICQSAVRLEIEMYESISLQNVFTVCLKTNSALVNIRDLTLILTRFDSFNLTQSVTGPTHEKGHTLYLVLSYGFCITISEICDMGISDHLPVLFTVVVPNSEISTCGQLTL